MPGKSHGWRSLVGCSPWGREESDTTERLHFHFSLSCIGEGNGNPLQCSCLENPRDGGAWWAAVCGVAQSWTRLKRLSSSSSSSRRLDQWFSECILQNGHRWGVRGRWRGGPVGPCPPPFFNLIVLSVQYSGIKLCLQCCPTITAVSRTFHHPKQKLYPPPPSPQLPLIYFWSL